MNKYKYISTQYNMSIRSDATTSADKIGQLDKGVYGYGDEVKDLPNGDKWIKVLTGGTAVGWVAVIHLGVVYGKIELIGDVTPPPVDPQPSQVPAYFDLTTPDGKTTRYVKS
jgi:hypothetical protein